MDDRGSLFLLGGTGFIGSQVVGEALAAGWRVKALTRSAQGRRALEAAGAEAIEGTAEAPSRWAEEAGGTVALIDLVQPKFPRRLSGRAVERIAEQRQATTRGVLGAIESLPAPERPLLFSVSGVDDLAPGAGRQVSDDSPVRSEPSGFGVIGIPVRRLIERSGVEATFVYFGALVYGAGKVFADVYVEGLKRGRARVLGPGDNHLPLTHVVDAARALVHLAGLPRERLAGRTFIASDGSDTTQRELLDDTAALMGVKRPGSAPAALGALIAGRAAVETMTADLHATPAALLETGFRFRFPTPREGLPETLTKLGVTSEAV